MSDILIKDNYFEDVDLIREIGLELDYSLNREKTYPHKGWRGKRTFSLIEYDIEILNNITDSIFSLCYDFFDLKNFIFPHNGHQAKNLDIATYYHINVEEDKNAFPNFSFDKFHKDFGCAITGVVYLTPNAPLEAGTSIFDGNINQIVNVENVYNRLVAFNSNQIHAPTDFFGNSEENGRMTFNFFILESEYINSETKQLKRNPSAANSEQLY